MIRVYWNKTYTDGGCRHFYWYLYDNPVGSASPLSISQSQWSIHTVTDQICSANLFPKFEGKKTRTIYISICRKLYNLHRKSANEEHWNIKLNRQKWVRAFTMIPSRTFDYKSEGFIDTYVPVSVELFSKLQERGYMIPAMKFILQS